MLYRISQKDGSQAAELARMQASQQASNCTNNGNSVSPCCAESEGHTKH